MFDWDLRSPVAAAYPICSRRATPRLPLPGHGHVSTLSARRPPDNLISMQPGRPRVVVLTGAGISADSGVATFRGSDGLWEGHRLEDVATPAAWRRDPATVWRFYQMRRAQLAQVAPNPAHRALTRLERVLAQNNAPFTLITQNVDDLHQRAGSTVLPMHGQLAVLRCEACGWSQEDRENLDPTLFVPCPACNHQRLRPDVVWFEEMPRHLQAIETAVSNCTHFFTIGTSGVVYPAAGYLAEARAIGAETWVLSLDEPENLHPLDRFVRGRAAEVIPAQVQTWLDGWRFG